MRGARERFKGRGEKGEKEKRLANVWLLQRVPIWVPKAGKEPGRPSGWRPSRRLIGAVGQRFCEGQEALERERSKKGMARKQQHGKHTHTQTHIEKGTRRSPWAMMGEGMNPGALACDNVSEAVPWARYAKTVGSK